MGSGPRQPFTARIERAQFHRARSASKKGTWPFPCSLFQRSRVEALADFDGEHAFVASGVECGQGEEIGLAFRKIEGGGVRGDIDRERRSSEIVYAGRSADIKFIASQVGLLIGPP